MSIRTEPHIYVISCGVSSDKNLPDYARAIVEKSAKTAAGKRLLEKYSIPHEKRVVLGADTVEVLKKLIDSPDTSGGDIAVLASGDALFHGIAATLLSITDSSRITVLPGITAFQALFSITKLPWSDFSFFSVHGKKEKLPLRRILSARSAAVYCDNKIPAHILAEKLIAFYPSAASRKAVAGADIGEKEEKLFTGTLQEVAEQSFSGLSILALLPPVSALEVPPLLLGTDDEFFEREKNLITHPEVRAVVISKLQLRGGIMWDLGAGSGSVGIEAAAIVPDLKVYAVEKSETRIEQIRANVQKAGVENHKLVHGRILDEIIRLPRPDFVFIGGGGPELEEILKRVYHYIAPGGRIVATAVTLESSSLLQKTLKSAFKSAVSVIVSRSAEVGASTMMKSENPITVFTFEKGI